MKILIDCDGPLANLDFWIMEKARELGLAMTKSEQPFILNRYERSNELREYMCAMSHDELPIIAGAQEAVSELEELGRVIIVTSPPTDSPTWVWQRTHWLKKNFGIRQFNISYTRDKSLVPGRFLIDDASNNLHDWAEENTGTPILFKSQTLVSIKDLQTLHVVYNWEQCLKLIKQTLKEDSRRNAVSN